MKEKERKIIIILIIVLLLVDQIIKIVLFTSNYQLGSIKGWSIGVLSNKKSENNISYILVAIIAVIAIARYIKSNNSYIKMNSRVILSFALAGVISNTIDRLWNGTTINYINIPHFSSLNLAYIYFIITWIGMAAILTKYTSQRILEKKNKDKD